MIKGRISKDWYFADFPITGEYAVIDLPHDYTIKKPRDPRGDMLNGYFPVTSGQYLKYLELDRGRHYVLDIDGAYSMTEVTFNEELLFLHIPAAITQRQAEKSAAKSAANKEPPENSIIPERR
jgi:hypothetical protein